MRRDFVRTLVNGLTKGVPVIVLSVLNMTMNLINFFIHALATYLEP
jgi:hypothetical protein